MGVGSTRSAGGHSAGGAGRLVFTNSAGTGTTDHADLTYADAAGVRKVQVKASTVALSSAEIRALSSATTTTFGKVSAGAVGSADVMMASYGTANPGGPLARGGEQVQNWSEFYGSGNTFGILFGVQGLTRLVFHQNNVNRAEFNATAGDLLLNNTTQFRVLAAAAAATLDGRGYNGLRISSGATALDHVRSDHAREGTPLWIFSDVAVNLNHNTGSVPANHSPLINASAAANVMAAGHVRHYVFFAGRGWTEMRLS